MNLHSFDPHIAKSVGVNAAVIYQNILFWTRKNLVNGKNIHDDYVWTYNSVKAWAELFPYLSADQTRRCLDKLEERGLIKSGNFNQSAYDRTKWYGVSTQIHLADLPNLFGENHEPIPDSKPDSKPDTDNGDFEAFWDAVPRKVGKGAARKAYAKAIKEADPYDLLEAMRCYARSRTGENSKFTVHASTWLTQGRWEDEPDHSKHERKPTGAEIADEIAASFGEVDSWENSTTVVPLLPARHPR